MKENKKVISRIGTHDGRFHTDDVMAVAAVTMCYPAAFVERTRDEAALAKCDLRIDVGHKYDPETGDFDHHQPGGAGARPNGIEYSSFGLIWKEYGVRIAGSQAVADYIDKTLVQAVDARDNGQSIKLPSEQFAGAQTFELSDLLDLFNPLWDEGASKRAVFDAFREAVLQGQKIIRLIVIRARSIERARGVLRQAIISAEDPRIVVLEQSYPWKEIGFDDAPRVRFVIYPGQEGNWRVEAVPMTLESYECRLKLPEAWAGLRDAELVAVTGVVDAAFVHRKCFVGGAKSKKGAIKLAQLALET